MRKSALTAAAFGVVGAMALTGCGSDSKNANPGTSSSASTSASAPASSAASSPSTSSAAAGGKVGVILPDTESSVRWETADRPLLKAAFEAAGIQADIQNAQNSKSKMATIADSMIQSGVKVLIITNLDSPSGAAIEAKAKAAGIKTIDYDRLTLGGSADYYVSFDNVKVGELQGEGLIKCLGTKKNAQIIEINGSPTDNNATLFKQGYDSKLKPMYDAGTYKKVGDKSIPDWKNIVGGTTFEQLLTANGGKVDGVLAANDGLGNAVIQVLRKNRLQVPVTGQDASTEGLQNILRGDQCMTVYKAIKKEAEGASKLAIALIQGKPAETNGTADDATGKRKVPSVLLEPVAIFKENIKDVFADGFVKSADVCTGNVAPLCKTAGIS